MPLERHLGSPSGFITGSSTQHVVHMPDAVVLPNPYIAHEAGAEEHLVRRLQNPLQM